MHDFFNNIIEFLEHIKFEIEGAVERFDIEDLIVLGAKYGFIIGTIFYLVTSLISVSFSLGGLLAVMAGGLFLGILIGVQLSLIGPIIILVIIRPIFEVLIWIIKGISFLLKNKNEK